MIQAQDNIVPVEISQEKIIVDGVIYYLHTVEKGQTLYSISKAYNISFFEITQENPDVMFGLMIGHVLKIPETGLKKKEEEENRFTFHHVEKGQTVYSLTKQYNIDTSILFSLNPDLRNGLKTDMVLKIPKEKKELTPDEEDYILYKVKRKDTLYSLSREFNVTISNIKEYNEELKTSQLKAGQLIKIPRRSVIASSIFDEYPEYQPTGVINYDSLIYYDSTTIDCRLLTQKKMKKQINVALLLPFYIDENRALNNIDTTIINFEESVKYKIYRKTYRFLEFYEGVLIAIDTLRKDGISINLNVFSIEDDTNDAILIADSLIRLHTDIIIGPVYRKTVKKIVDMLRNENIKIILPFSTEDDIALNNPNVFMVRHTDDNEMNLAAELLSNYYTSNIVLVSPKTFVDSLSLAKFKEKLFSKIAAKTDIDHVLIKEVMYNDTVQKSLEHSLSRKMKNVIYINSTKETFVSEIITKLNGLLLTHKIDVLGFPRWQLFINLDVEYFYNLNLKYLSPFNVNYDNPEVKKFLNKYHQYFYTEPNWYSYSFIGYDLMFYFSKAFHYYGSDFPYCMSSLHINTTNSDFRFYKINNTGGFINMSENIYSYSPGFQIVKYNSISDLINE